MNLLENMDKEKFSSKEAKEIDKLISEVKRNSKNRP